ncbi:DUF5677 domain-containing protein [Lysinibacillus pakistanensis]|uniref:DUF5677 domain-containing protein n=1 Tax=Lysinibacillus pakistanensis TaxID=759811 RepID=A0AAX3X3H3_9BACI|nr:DUF5677 domain-containing protein [Lysinibacillus pakistanensis]MDM5233362.1 DUF5677 domain-containing protein [Lysinibacillus pakistanensis]WHY48836.1 DUF5677 domain-containing protein [Lysinibacillus pakistanensis]WHY53848.1 DUF5677 domain-containing protein [Lysinibacillus pakistanensis]
MNNLKRYIKLGYKFKEKLNAIKNENQEEKLLVTDMLYSDILEKSESILLLTSQQQYRGAPSMLRSIYENYIYIKYIFERRKYVNNRAEAYYLWTQLEIQKIMNVINSKEKKGEIVRKELIVSAITPFLKNGSIEEMINRYNTLTEGKMVDLFSKIPNFYSKSIEGKKYSSFELLCEYLDETFYYEIIYRILSLEVHGKSKELNSYGNWDEFIQYQCNFLIMDSTMILSKHFGLRKELEKIENYIL